MLYTQLTFYSSLRLLLVQKTSLFLWDPLLWTCKHFLALICADLWRSEIRGFLCSHQKLLQGMGLLKWFTCPSIFLLQRELIINTNMLDFPLKLEKFLCSLYFLMPLRCYGSGHREKPWETTPTRQPEGLFPGHYTSTHHLCYSWITVQFWSSVSICDSFSHRLPAF